MQTISQKPVLDPKILKQALDEIRAELRSRMGGKLVHHGDVANATAHQAEAHASAQGELPKDPAGTEGMTEGQPNDEGEDPGPIISAPSGDSAPAAGPTTKMIAALDEKKKAAVPGQSFYSKMMDTSAKRMLKAKI